MKPFIFFTLTIVIIIVVAVLYLSFFKKTISRQSNTPVKPIQSATPMPTSPLLTLFTNGSRSQAYVALTFDADMTPGMLKKLQRGEVNSYYDKNIINLLTQEKIPATIFTTGLWAKTYSKDLEEIASNPLFEIGNHTYTHYAFSQPCYNLPPLPQTDKEDDIVRAQETIKSITGTTPKLFRFPGGCYTQQDLELVNHHNLTTIAWDVESGDAFNNNAQEIIQKIMNKTQNGSIIVMHLNGTPNAPKTLEVLQKIIYTLKDKGYTFVRVSTLLNQN